MNRIYQGKVTAVVEIPDGKDEPGKPLDLEVLWRHHELFQDAVNYYTLALAGMAAGLPPSHPLWRWRNQVHGHWCKATKKAVVWNYPYEAVAKLFGLSCATDGSEKLESKFFEKSKTTQEARAAAVAHLTSKIGDDEGKVRDIAGAKLTFLCTPYPDAATDTEQAAQLSERQRVVNMIRLTTPDKLTEAAKLIDLKYFITKQPKQFLSGEKAVVELKKRFKKLTEGTKRKLGRFPSLIGKQADFERHCSKLPADFSMPAVGRKTPAEYNPAAVFRAYPILETWEAFTTATNTLAKRKLKESGSDPLAEGRQRGFPYFEYFTNLRLIRKPGAQADTRSVWHEFDLAAFIEALKSPHRYLQDSKKRDRAVAELEMKRKAILEGEGASETTEVGDGETPAQFGFKDDPRLKILEQMLSEDGDLLVEAETDAESDAKGKPRYRIRQRTLRGWRRLREVWLKLAEKSEITRDKLKAAIDKEQGEHKDDFGSATLYHVLMKLEYHDLWRDCSSESWWRNWHAHDLLTSWKDYQDLLDELKNKSRDIRFTPAHAQYSPRFFTFPKLQSEHHTGLIAGASRDQMNYNTHLVVETDGRLMKTAVRLTFSAPRLQRDSLRSQDESNLSERPWLQPMLKALGFEKELALQDFGKCSVGLNCVKKQGEIQPLLTFPMSLDRLSLVRNIYKLRGQLGFFRERKRLKQLLPDGGWDYQFVWYGDDKDRQNYYLRWHSELAPSQQKAGYWWEKVSSFSLLSIDLGQRQAGASALIRVSCKFTGEKLAKARYIGTTPNGKLWFALVEATSLLKLPGEDAEAYRHQTWLDVQRGEQSLERAKDQAFREELHGERGRTANETETLQTQLLLREFGQLELLDANCRDTAQAVILRTRLSFPEQNDKLLVGFRRAQSHALRLHRWTWFLRLGAQKKRRALREMAKAHNEEWLKKTLDQRKAIGLLTALDTLLCRYREKLPTQLVVIANRVYPSHRGRLRWNHHPDKSDCFILEFKEWEKLSDPRSPALADFPKPTRMPYMPGQRGLSLKRIEQFEELRKRCQSLNQTMRRVVGGEPMKSRDDSIPDPCSTLLTKLENLKEQRCHHTAHFILAQALGVELRKPELSSNERERRDIHGEYQRIKRKDGFFRPVVDFIVIEDLSRYRASQGRAPRENSRLMKWCHGHVRDKLKELCEPFGLPVAETPAAYSSRFCSRSGVAGFRATELSPAMLRDSKWQWRARLPAEGKEESEDRQKERKRWEEVFSNLLQANLARIGVHSTTTEWRELLVKLELAENGTPPAKRKPYRTIILPETGGEIFVPIQELDSTYTRLPFEERLPKKKRPPIVQFMSVRIEEKRITVPRIIQADINAAVNLGLRAIADPQLWSIHPRLRCLRQSAENKSENDKFFTNEKRKFGDLDADGRKEIKLWKTKDETYPGYIKSSETKHPNFFADYAEVQNARWGVATIEGSKATTPKPPHLVTGKSLWTAVKDQQWQRCTEINSARLSAWSHGTK